MLMCRDCPGPVSAQSKSGRCKPCSFAYMRATYDRRRLEALARTVGTQAYRQKMSMVQKERLRKDPEFAARFRAASKAARIRVHDHPAWHTPEVNEKRRASWMRTVYSWCPERFIDEYRRLVRSKGLRAAHARAVIESQFTPFDRQLLKVRNGAGITVSPPMPSKAYDYSMGGSSLL